MKLVVFGLSLVLVLINAACGSSSGGSKGIVPDAKNTVNADGTCTDKFLNEYNTLYDIYVAAQAAGTPDKIKVVVDQCDSFFTQHKADVKCEASSQGQVVTMDTEMIKTKCDEMKAQVNGQQPQ